MKWIIIIIVSALAIALLVFLVIRNQKDEKELEEKLNKDYPKYKEKESSVKGDEPNNDNAV
jgi:protein-S-isoprenylcysteine O-methyltransferase Ste14